MITDENKIKGLLDSNNTDSQKLGVSLASDLLGWKVETIVDYVFDNIDVWDIVKKKKETYFGKDSLEITYKRYFFDIPLIQTFEEYGGDKTICYNCSFSDQITEAINDFL